MKTIYLPVFTIFLFSCASIRYTGSEFPKTNLVEVYVTETAINKPFTYVGRGYVTAGISNPEWIQKISVLKAKEKGADAILLYDYAIPNGGTYINNTFRTDSIGRSLVTTGNTSVQHTLKEGFAIFFIKYK